MDILDQIREQLEHIKAYRQEIVDLEEKIQKVNNRVKRGKIYGTESEDVKKYNARIREIGKQLVQKEEILKGLHQKRQQPLFH